MITTFDPLLRRSDNARIIGLTTSVAAKACAFLGVYGASKSAFETPLLAYANENRADGRLAVAIVDPGATRTKMRALAYPGEDPMTLKEPGVVADRVVALANDGFETGLREVVK